ncbi:MAG TPA: DEAD/DEAH box helicase family protein [Gaiellaceae bacterium]|nr:DEAD/DEAH box helicase family protein [Gaiellaceae bacterium]
MTAVGPKTLDVDDDLIAAVAARLDLREPNAEALRAIVYTASQHYDVERRAPPYECVVDVATGVGKTYVLAAAVEYWAARGVRDFAVVTPGRTILDKTIANFTPGHPRSLVGAMDAKPVVVTAENFAGVDHLLPDDVKLYVFSVQSLIKPTAKQGRRVHTFQETLGDQFYGYLQALPNLVLFADEHHVYYGKAFSAAIRDLGPRVLVGLTATPHKDTPREQIVYAYPLAHAIADRLVKTPVIVGRHDERHDPRTKLADGLRLLEAKRALVERYCGVTGAEPVNPVMLVIATKIDEAEEVEAILRAPDFLDGRYADAVLTVHSNKPDDALAELDTVEAPDSRVRVIVSVGMLKEGWDVKNVYAICSLRPMLSELLQEQTLGRGLRLPFGAYTDVRLLDTLEVLAHEKYDQLLKKKGVLDQEFVDWRTRLVVHTDPLGDQSVTVETSEVPGDLAVGGGEAGRPSIEELGARETAAARETESLAATLRARDVFPAIELPRLTMSEVKHSFSLNDVTDLDAFAKLGRQFALEPDDHLRREEIVAIVERGADGLVRTQLGTRRGEAVASQVEQIPLGEARERLVDAVLHADVVTLRVGEDVGAARIVDAFLGGLGDEAERVLSGFLATAAARLVRAVTAEHKRFLANPEYTKVVTVEPFAPERLGRVETSDDRTGPWKRGVGYTGWAKSLYDQDWFDSGLEKQLAVVLDDAAEIEVWARLQRGDLRIVWESDGRVYEPDFVAVEQDGTHWVVEAKADRDLPSREVAGKELAAKRWAQHVGAQTGVEWRYLLAGETDVAEARGSWASLKQLGRS